jgi:hypothetical protein
MTPALIAALALSAHARDKDACGRIKPEQQLSTESSQALDAMIKVRVVGMGGGEGAVKSESSASYDTSLLEGDDLARAWYTYQLCVLKETGAITPTMHEELMRKAWGLEPTQVATAATTAGGEVGGAAIAATSSMTFLPTEGKATVVLATCSETTKLGAPKPPGAIWWKINGEKVRVPTTEGIAVDVPPGRISLEAGYRYMTVSARANSEFVVEAGKVHYIAADYDFRFGNVVSMALRAASPGEGEQVLGRCAKTSRH